MGLPRSGSLAIHEFFLCQGLTSQHSCTTSESCKTTCGECIHSNLNHSLPAFQNCGSPQVWASFDAELQEPFAWFLPQHFLLPIIHQEYPDSVWILNTRESSERWGKQIRHWHTITTRMLHSFGKEYNQGELDLAYSPNVNINEPEEVTKAMQKTLERTMDEREHQRRLDDLVEIHDMHVQKVKQFAARYGHKLIELNVDDPSAGSVLSDAFDLHERHCWSFDGQALDNDYLDFSIKL